MCVAVVVPVRAEISGLSLSALPRWPINDRWSVFGRLGVFDWESDVRVVSGSFAAAATQRFDDNRELLAGVGVRYELPGGLGLVVEQRRFDLTGSWASLGASWRF